MADKEPCCCEMAALRSEIDRRSRNDRRHLVARMAVRANVEPLSSLPTATLISRLRDSQRAIYGTDDRRDLYQVAETELRKVADSVVALVGVSDLHQRRDGRYKLSTTRYRDDYELCPSGPFFDQPLGCDCTGFLVAPDILCRDLLPKLRSTPIGRNTTRQQRDPWQTEPLFVRSCQISVLKTWHSLGATIATWSRPYREGTGRWSVRCRTGCGTSSERLRQAVDERILPEVRMPRRGSSPRRVILLAPGDNR